MGRMLWLLGLLCWPLTGWCASPVPTELYAEVDHALRTEVVLADPIGYRGRTLLLGGKVERTLSEPGRVTVQLVGYRLDDDDRPLIPGPDLGRLVVSDVQVDGARLQPGRLVTVVGRVVGWGESDGRALPRLASRFVHPWPTPEEEAAARRLPGSCCDPWCDLWWHDPWCDPWYYGPYPRWYWGGGYYRYRR